MKTIISVFPYIIGAAATSVAPIRTAPAVTAAIFFAFILFTISPQSISSLARGLSAFYMRKLLRLDVRIYE